MDVVAVAYRYLGSTGMTTLITSEVHNVIVTPYDPIIYNRVMKYKRSMLSICRSIETLRSITKHATDNDTNFLNNNHTIFTTDDAITSALASYSTTAQSAPSGSVF